MPRIEDYPDMAIDVQMAQDGAQEMPDRMSDAYGIEDGGAYDAGGAYRSGPRMNAYGSEAGSGAYGTGGTYNSEYDTGAYQPGGPYARPDYAPAPMSPTDNGAYGQQPAYGRQPASGPSSAYRSPMGRNSMTLGQMNRRRS